MKLTKAEIRLLKKLAHSDVACAPRSGTSAIALRLAGYADWDGEAGRSKWWLSITDEGRAALKDSTNEN